MGFQYHISITVWFVDLSGPKRSEQLTQYIFVEYDQRELLWPRNEESDLYRRAYHFEEFLHAAGVQGQAYISLH